MPEMDIARYWRLRKHLLGPFTGSRRVLENEDGENGTVQFKLLGSSNWFEANEDPFKGGLIYQTPSEESVMPLEIHAEVEISASTV